MIAYSGSDLYALKRCTISSYMDSLTDIASALDIKFDKMLEYTNTFLTFCNMYECFN